MARLSPKDYLLKVLTTIEKRGLRSKTIDWQITRVTCLEMIKEAQSTSDTYAAINYVLSQLGDEHSFLITRSGAGTKAIHDTPSTPKRVLRPSLIVSDNKRYGFVTVSSCGSKSSTPGAMRFARALQTTIAETSAQSPTGWIVDLRDNTGGNMWPMLVGIGPLLGAGKLGSFQYPKMSIPWFYENGQAGVINRIHGKYANFKLTESLADLPHIPVAVLIGPATASSGEALAISFRGRRDTYFVGEHTRGLSTNNESIKLPDGATLYLTTSGEADRNNIAYERGVSPDLTVVQGDVPLGHMEDPAIEAAAGWLHTHQTTGVGS